MVMVPPMSGYDSIHEGLCFNNGDWWYHDLAILTTTTTWGHHEMALFQQCSNRGYARYCVFFSRTMRPRNLHCSSAGRRAERLNPNLTTHCASKEIRGSRARFNRFSGEETAQAPGVTWCGHS
ncbi:hypothetical protein CDAR_206611 [Caerostris darwini]|uniref:Uncharacterized protein n=1 Tax=Caerostris darwini TaxID=1538125 RepID=A0AAV4S9D0_9ARAC|nr:hypothetical protein CDAR_206611 [Caerostris darwini]